MALKVRELLYVDDFPQFVDMASAMQQECEPDIPFVPETLVVHMFRCVNDCERKTLNAWIVFRNTEQIGMAVATASQYFFNPSTITELHYWYVKPQYRLTRAGPELLRAFEKWSRDLGALRMHFGADRVDFKEADSINRMIAKRGFVRYGEQFYKVIDHGHQTGLRNNSITTRTAA
jgi:GNAT superfamily N-acetyltransferase